MKAEEHDKKIDELEGENWDIDYNLIKDIISGVREEGRRSLLEDEAREVLDIAGIPIAEGAVVHSMEGCVEKAEEIGYPVVLKVVSEDISHKMDVGGIAIGLEDEEEVKEGYEAIHSRVKSKRPDAHIRGISVAEMVEGGEEVVVGGMIDPSFGPVVMFGLGGIYVEIFEDVEFRVAPITKAEAERMMGDIESYPLLIGSRGQPKKDLDALAEIISRLGDLMYYVEEINDIDLNPVMSLEEGAKALDVVINLQ